MGTLRQKISERVLADDERAIQSTFVYQCLLLDGLEREYELLALEVRQLLDLLAVPDEHDVCTRLRLAKEMIT